MTEDLISSLFVCKSIFHPSDSKFFLKLHPGRPDEELTIKLCQIHSLKEGDLMIGIKILHLLSCFFLLLSFPYCWSKTPLTFTSFHRVQHNQHRFSKNGAETTLSLRVWKGKMIKEVHFLRQTTKIFWSNLKFLSLTWYITSKLVNLEC